MKIKRGFAMFLKDDCAGEMMEYALIAGVIILAAIAVMAAIGGKVVVHWTTINCNL